MKVGKPVSVPFRRDNHPFAVGRAYVTDPIAPLGVSNGLSCGIDPRCRQRPTPAELVVYHDGYVVRLVVRRTITFSTVYFVYLTKAAGEGIAHPAVDTSRRLGYHQFESIGIAFAEPQLAFEVFIAEQSGTVFEVDYIGVVLLIDLCRRFESAVEEVVEVAEHKLVAELRAYVVRRRKPYRQRRACRRVGG